MSLRFALLGLLAEGPSSGYDLARRFEEGVGTFAWSARHSQIYPELARLAADGFVTEVAQGPRGRRDYAISAPGREALRDWLLGPWDSGSTVRNEFALRMFLLSALEVDDATEVLDDVDRFVSAQLVEIEAAQREMAEAGVPPDHGPSMAAEYGLRAYRATQEWAAWAREQLRGRLADGR